MCQLQLVLCCLLSILSISSRVKALSSSNVANHLLDTYEPKGLGRQGMMGQYCQTDFDCDNQKGFLKCVKEFSHGGVLFDWGICQTPWDFARLCQTSNDCPRGYTCGMIYCKESDDPNALFTRAMNICRYRIFNERDPWIDLKGLNSRNQESVLEYYMKHCYVVAI